MKTGTTFSASYLFVLGLIFRNEEEDRSRLPRVGVSTRSQYRLQAESNGQTRTIPAKAGTTSKHPNRVHAPIRCTARY